MSGFNDTLTTGDDIWPTGFGRDNSGNDLVFGRVMMLLVSPKING